jgi:hypothetical protein
MRKVCKRKVYALVNPISMAIEGACITDDERLKQLADREMLSINEMMTGKGTLRTWQDLVDMNNVCQTMGRNGIGPECLVDCMMAEIELKSAAKRYEKTGKMGLTAQGIKSIKEVHEWHNLQRKSISRSEFEAQIKMTLSKLRSRSKEVEVLN